MNSFSNVLVIMKAVYIVFALVTICVLTGHGGRGVEREITLGQKARVVVYVDNKMRPSLDKLALSNGFDYMGRVRNPDPIWDGYYVLEGIADTELKALESNGIGNVMIEKMARRDKRSLTRPRDPLWAQQWNLRPRVDSYFLREYENMNQLPAWGRGYTGLGVVVGIVDSGVDYTVPELAVNYLSNYSFDYFDNDTDPYPHNSGAHGTSCAGLAAAVSDSMCGVGVAPDANIASIKIFKDGENNVFTTDLTEAMALSHELQHIDIFSNSWGPADSGDTLGKPGILTRKAIEAGLEQGRGGKGAIYVWAAGNGREVGDNCGSDGYIQQVGPITVTSLAADGSAAEEAEGCGAVLVTAYSSGESYHPWVITSPPKPGAECNTRFGETSAAAAAVSGVIALMLEANPGMGWRDVQHVLVNTARKADPLHSGWKRNAAGFWYNEQFGFGLVNAFAAVNRASVWENVGERIRCTQVGTLRRTIRNSDEITLVEHNYSTSNCSNGSIGYLEHVAINLEEFSSLNRRGGWRITLVSPAGTESVLLYDRPSDYRYTNYQDWVLSSSNFWGENPEGEWTLKLEYVNTKVHNSSIAVRFVYYGIEIPPRKRNSVSGDCGGHCEGKCTAESNECDECTKYYIEETGYCTESCCNEGEVAELELKKCRIFRDRKHPEVYLKKGVKNGNVYLRYNGSDLLLCTPSILQNFADRICETMDYSRAEAIHKMSAPIANSSFYVARINCEEITWETPPYECVEDSIAEFNACDSYVWEIKCTNYFYNNCTYPKEIPNGRYITERGMALQDRVLGNGSKLFLSCNKGYVTEGDAFLTCVHGQWDSEPSCRQAEKEAIYLDKRVSALSYGLLTYYVMEDGSLEEYSVCYNARYSMWDEKNGQVACRQLGYKGFEGVMGVNTRKERYLLISFDCNGKESRLSECSYFENKLVRCTQRVAINCSEAIQVEPIINSANSNTRCSIPQLFILLMLMSIILVAC